MAHRYDMTREQLSTALAKSLNALKLKIDELDGKPAAEKPKHVKQGKREDLGIYFRSAWEANVARWLNSQQILWEYEPRVFFFDKFRSGTNSYCPDFYLPDSGEWLEIKGQLIGPAKAASRRFKKYYPNEFEKLRVITGSPSTMATTFFQELGVPIFAFYNELNKQFKNTIPHWEN
jgi:hypothetical protein